jgi:hypothetical protein
MNNCNRICWLQIQLEGSNVSLKQSAVTYNGKVLNTVKHLILLNYFLNFYCPKNYENPHFQILMINFILNVAAVFSIQLLLSTKARRMYSHQVVYRMHLILLILEGFSLRSFYI